MPRITALIASDIMIQSVMIGIGRKSRVLLAYSLFRRNVKMRKHGLPRSSASVVWRRTRAVRVS
jgi:hypothetical protein